MKTFKKTTNSIIAFSVMITATIFTSCNSPAEKVETAKDNVTEAEHDLTKAQDDYAIEVANFRKESDEKITANEKLISDIKESIAKDKKSVKAAYKEQIAVLEQKNSDMKKRLSEYKEEEGNEKWQSFKREFNRDMDELGNSLKDFTVDNKKYNN